MLEPLIRKLTRELIGGALQQHDPEANARLAEAYWQLHYLSRLGLLRLPDVSPPPIAMPEPDRCGTPGGAMADDVVLSLVEAVIHKPEPQPRLGNIISALSDRSLQLAVAETLAERVGSAAKGLQIDVARLRAELHALNQNRILRIPFSVTGVEVAATSQRANLTVEKVNIAWKQALSYWSAITPLVFKPPLAGEDPMLRIRFEVDHRESAELGTASGFISSTPSGPVGVSTVTIDCDRKLFVDAFLEEEFDPVRTGPFDLVAVLTHEIGHAIGLDHPPLDPATGNETEPAIMSKSFGPGEIVRRLFPFDTREAQRLHGALHLGETVRANLAETGVLVDAPTSFQLQRGSFGLVVFGPVKTRALLDVVVRAKGRLINALRLKGTTVADTLFINRVEVFDGIIPIQQYSVSARSIGNEGLAGRPFDIKLGVHERRTLGNDLLVRLELLITDKLSHSSSEFGVLQLEEVSVETLPAPMVVDSVIG